MPPNERISYFCYVRAGERTVTSTYSERIQELESSGWTLDRILNSSADARAWIRGGGAASVATATIIPPEPSVDDSLSYKVVAPVFRTLRAIPETCQAHMVKALLQSLFESSPWAGEEVLPAEESMVFDVIAKVRADECFHVKKVEIEDMYPSIIVENMLFTVNVTCQLVHKNPRRTPLSECVFSYGMVLGSSPQELAEGAYKFAIVEARDV